MYFNHAFRYWCEIGPTSSDRVRLSRERVLIVEMINPVRFVIGSIKEKVVASIPPLNTEDAQPKSRELLAEQVASHGRATNMKRTLAHSPAALFALMRWYDLHAEVVGFLGKRATTLFAFAISNQTDCLICSTFFRRWLIESGENDDRPHCRRRFPPRASSRALVPRVRVRRNRTPRLHSARV